MMFLPRAGKASIRVLLAREDQPNLRKSEQVLLKQILAQLGYQQVGLLWT